MSSSSSSFNPAQRSTASTKYSSSSLSMNSTSMSTSRASNPAAAAAAAATTTTAVDSQSVQQQFATLTRSRDVLRAEVNKLDADRRRQESVKATLYSQSQSLSSQLHAIHESLGKHGRMKQLWMQEKTRLTQVLQDERQQLEQVSTSMQQMLLASQESKQDHCRQLSQLSTDMEDLAQKHEDRHWTALLMHENSPQVLQSFISKVLNRAGDNHVALEDVLQLHDWIDAHRTLKDNYQLHQAMLEEVHEFRKQASMLEPHTNWTVLEQGWMDGSHDALQMDFLYGDTSTSPTTAPTMDTTTMSQ